MVTINRYQELAMRTANLNASPKELLMECGLGIAGEAGEVADRIKKSTRQGHEIDREKLLEELGDVAWYIAYGCYLLNADMESVLQCNIDKLRKRYPEGFDAERSVRRTEYGVE